MEHLARGALTRGPGGLVHEKCGSAESTLGVDVGSAAGARWAASKRQSPALVPGLWWRVAPPP